ncbi:MAG: recombinase family protein [Candidatus Riflebacteria bacterium]|nr:recombinase family protein [Candidatus Riflebacteria bacterium]
MKTVGYIRVSTQDQAESGLSLKHQEEKIKAYCEAMDFELIEIRSDAGFSGKSLKRPAIQDIIKMIQEKQVEAVVILKLDRLTRSVKDLCYLVELFEKLGVALVSVQDSINTTTAAGRLVVNVLGSVSQWEREAIAERTKAALGVKKQQGLRIGGIPFGFKIATDNKTLLSVESEQEALGLIRELRSSGLSYRKIAAELELRGIPTKKGGKVWQAKTILNLCQIGC